MRARTRCRGLSMLLVLGVCAGTGMVLASDEAGGLASQYAAQVEALLPLLDTPVEPLLLQTALADVRRAVAEIDQIVASDTDPGPGGVEAGGVRGVAATAHLHLAAFEIMNRDFEAARRNVERARQLLGTGADVTRLPWATRQDMGPHRAPVTYYERRTATEVESFLRATWTEARPVPFDLEAVAADDLPTLVLSESPGSAGRDSDLPLVKVGTAIFRDLVTSGKRSFAVPLPAGLYRVGGRADSGLDRLFLVTEASEIDPVVVGGQRFVLRLTVAGRADTPRFFLNGMEIRDTSAMPYGYYRVDTDREHLNNAPNLIRFVPGPGINEKSRTVWTVYVPAGGLTELRFGDAALGNPLWN